MKNYLILIVDDSPENLRIISDYLKETDLSLTILNAPNGKIGCMLAEKRLPDLIITDWEMPVMNGIEMLQHINSNEFTKDIPVIMATGVMTSAENMKTAMDAGAVDYIRKPIDKIELMARVSSMLKLADSYKEIKLLNVTKDKFFSIIAHDLRSPFNNVLGFNELLINGYNSLTNEERLEYIKKSHQSSWHAFNLLENLLTWSHTQSGKIQYTPERLNLNELISETFSLLKPNVDKKNIDFINSINNELSVFADRNTTATVLRNLLSNSIKFTHKNGSITISAKLIQKTSEFVEICVSDTGVGMSEKKVRELFKVENNISIEGTEGEKGTGLGLVLCYEFVVNNGGEIRVESEENVGSKFYFILPSYTK